MGDIYIFDTDPAISREDCLAMQKIANMPYSIFVNRYKAKENICCHIRKDIAEGRSLLSGGVDELMSKDNIYTLNLDEEKRERWRDFYIAKWEEIQDGIDVLNGIKEEAETPLGKAIVETLCSDEKDP